MIYPRLRVCRHGVDGNMLVMYRTKRVRRGWTSYMYDVKYGGVFVGSYDRRGAADVAYEKLRNDHAE